MILLLKRGKKHSVFHSKKSVIFYAKNVKASVNRKQFENLKEAKMVSQPNNAICPVKRLKEYLQMLLCTKDNCLFPGVKKDGSFSTSTVLGKDKLGNFMKTLSKIVGLETQTII